MYFCLVLWRCPCFGLCAPHSGRVWHALNPSTPAVFLILVLLFPSHLIAFDKCPYWLHIIRFKGGSLRLYYSGHIPHLFSILHGWHICLCEVLNGARTLSVDQFQGSLPPLQYTFADLKVRFSFPNVYFWVYGCHHIIFLYATQVALQKNSNTDETKTK